METVGFSLCFAKCAGFNDSERMEFRPIIHSQLFNCVLALASLAAKLDIPIDDQTNVGSIAAYLTRQESLQSLKAHTGDVTVVGDLAATILSLWKVHLSKLTMTRC
jgi:hypothetical protein